MSKALCGFNNTNLEALLKEGGIKNVLIAGFLTNFCVESTARSAYDKGNYNNFFHLISSFPL
jgi:ureidoacrylate peracid hydrolase